MLLCAVRRHEVYKTYDIVRPIDPQAFIIVGDAGEITGEGFRLPEENGEEIRPQSGWRRKVKRPPQQDVRCIPRRSKKDGL